MPLFLLLALFVSSLYAAEVPDAGQILRQQEQNTPKIEHLPPPEIYEPEVLVAPEKGVTIVVKSIVITGGESLESNDVLQALVADAIGQ
ncbi:MAG: hypothetical protein PHN45_06335, partial [Methylococcales bacterium]|nr:hypothetical protein [Methylococcales bacterium]